MINYDIEAQYSFESNMSDEDLDNQIIGIKKAVEDYLTADLRALFDYENILINVKIDPDLSQESHNEAGKVKISISNSSPIEGIEQELNAFTFTYGDGEEVSELDIIVDVKYWNYDIFKFGLLNALEESKDNELDKMAKFNKKHDKGQGYFVKMDAGNVPLNNNAFNQGVGITEDMNKEKVILEYEGLLVGDDYINWDFYIDKATVEDYLGDILADWEQFDYDEPQRSKDINQYAHDHFDELLDSYYDQVLDYFEDWAREDAEENYEPYDPRDDYERYDDLDEGINSRGRGPWPYVLYKEDGLWKGTFLSNYQDKFWDPNAMKTFHGFEDPEKIKNYLYDFYPTLEVVKIVDENGEDILNEDYWDSAIGSTFDKEKRKELVKKKEYYHWYDIINVSIKNLISAKMHEFDIKWDMYLNEDDRQDLLKMLEDKIHKIIDKYSSEQLEQAKKDINSTKYLNNESKTELIKFIDDYLKEGGSKEMSTIKEDKETKKYKTGDETTLIPYTPEYTNFEYVAKKLGGKVEDVYLDYGQKWMWTTIVKDDAQILYPAEWKEIANAESAKELDEVVAKHASRHAFGKVKNESINIKEELNKIDSQTYCEYDLLNSYNSIKWDVNKKNILIEKLNKKSSAKELNKFFESLINEEDGEEEPKEGTNIKHLADVINTNTDVILVDDARTFDLTKYQNQMIEDNDDGEWEGFNKLEESLGDRYLISKSDVQKVLDTIISQDTTYIVPSFKNNSFKKEYNVTPSNVKDVVRQLSTGDYSYTTHSVNRYYYGNELSVFTPDKSIKMPNGESITGITLYIKIDSAFGDPSIIVSLHPAEHTEEHPYRESYNEDEHRQRYKLIRIKKVTGSDGFADEYAMYYDKDAARYVFVFGDTDIYDPNERYTEYFDYQTDDEDDAYEWFNNYEGPGEVEE